MKFNNSFVSNLGRVRLHNEDSVTVIENSNGQILAVVADGMGGHRAGEVGPRPIATKGTMRPIKHSTVAFCAALTLAKTEMTSGEPTRPRLGDRRVAMFWTLPTNRS